MSQSSTVDHIPGEGWSDVQVLDYLVTCFDRDTILNIVLGFSAQWFDKRLIGITGRRAIQSFAQAGWETLTRFSDEEIKGQRAVLEPDALVTFGAQRGRADDLGLGPLFEHFGLATDTDIATIPVPISGRTAIVLVGAPSTSDLVTLEVVCQAVGEQLETVIKMAKSDALPEESRRIPPFPQPANQPARQSAQPTAAGSPPGTETDLSEPSDQTAIGAPVPRMPGALKARPERRTLQSGEFAQPFTSDPSKPRLKKHLASSHTQQLDISEAEEDNAPRLGRAPSESEAGEVAPAPSNPSATMFGLPAYPNKKKEPAQPVADSSSTMFGVPGTENLDFVRGKSDKSGVSVLPDHGVGDGASEGKRTLMGGLEASRDIVGNKPEEDSELLYDPSVFKSEAELAAESKLEVDEPTSNPNKMTMRGGFEVNAMADALREQVEREDSEAFESERRDELDDSRPIALDQLAEPASIEPLVKSDESSVVEVEPIVEPSEAAIELGESSQAEPAPEDEKPQKKSSIPQAMILRPARKIGSKSKSRSKQASGDADKEKSTGEPEPTPAAQPPASHTEVSPPEADYAAASSSSADDDQREARELAPAAMEESSPSFTARGVGDVPVAAESDGASDDALGDAFDQFAKRGRGDLYESSNHTAIGGAWSAKPKEPEAENEPVDDAWLDYFAPEEEIVPEAMAPDSEPVRSQQAGPSTIPPEAIERIMDSGPHIVELQEHFMLMDSRDQQRAFQAADDVAALGDESIPVLELMFPGRLFVDRYQYTADTLPPISEHGPILAALVRIGDSSLYIARKFLDHGVIESRFYAVYLLTQLSAEGLIGDLYERLFDRDVQTRTVARKIVAQYRRVGHFDSAILGPLREELRTGNDDSRVEIAAELLAEFRDMRAVENLLVVLGSYQGRANQALHRALQRITLKSWSSPYEWRHWWASAKDQKRQTWMVEALNSPSDSIRTMVFEEIQRLPGLDLNYHPDQPAKLRERAQGQLIDWFASRMGGSE